MKKKIGITTTIPIEIIYAADCIPVDLNNIFITDSDAENIVAKAEELGYPRSICAWIKGIYATVTAKKPVDALVIVTQGDCSNTISMLETFKNQNIEIFTFDFPYDHNTKKLKSEMEKLAFNLNTSVDKAEEIRKRLISIREKLVLLDRMTYENFLISGFENHLWLVSSSDFNGNPDKFENDLDEFLKKAANREPKIPDIKLGLIGIPPIITDLYGYLESKNAAVIFNEIQRQFSMPYKCKNLLEQYLNYTYPYDIFQRLDSIYPEIEKRKINAFIHYVQLFCHRQIEDMVLREKILLPMLTVEGDRPVNLDERAKIRIDSFLDILK